MIISWPRIPTSTPTNTTTSSRSGLVSLPEAVLDRHGASVLRTTDAAMLPGQPVIRPTVYRTFVLLIRNELVTGSNITAINGVLGRIGLNLDMDAGPDSNLPPGAPLPIGLLAADTREPVVVDAWRALQALRAAVRNGELPEGLVNNISLDHLLFGSAATGVGLGIVEGVPGLGNGNGTGPGGESANYGYWPHPVALAMDLPRRRTVKSLPGGRRVVVAVLDTGIDENKPLGVAVKNQNGQEHVVSDFVHIDRDIQQAVYESGRKLQNKHSGREIELIVGVRELPFTIQPLIGDLATHTGHGTFIAGIIRQAAPDADVLAVKVLRSDGVGYQSDALAALWKLLERVEKAQDGRADPATMVDVVSLSWGYSDESPEHHLPSLAEVVDELRCRGVVVVAAAGNYASDRPFYPAALATEPVRTDRCTPPPEPVISVSALNPNGSKAIYANEGTWVTCWATGTAVISTFPQRINASRNPSLRVRATNGKNLPQSRESLDGDDHAGGFREWTGTSFAAPFVAAEIAAKLQKKGLCELPCHKARERARQAVRAVRAKWSDNHLPLNGQVEAVPVGATF